MSSRKFVHRMVKQTAVEMAECYYEEAAHDNEFYRFYPDRRFFVGREWKRFVKPARQTLASMLARTDVSDFVKSEIHEALLLDRGLPQGQTAAAALASVPTELMPNLKLH